MRQRAPSAATAPPPFNSVRKPSTRLVGQSDRLARLRFLTRPFSRKLARDRMAGGEPAIGDRFDIHGAMISALIYMATRRSKERHGYRREPGFYALRSKNLAAKQRQIPREAQRREPLCRLPGAFDIGSSSRSPTNRFSAGSAGWAAADAATATERYRRQYPGDDPEPVDIGEDIGFAPDQIADSGEALQCRVARTGRTCANTAVAVATAASARCEPAKKCNPVRLE